METDIEMVHYANTVRREIDELDFGIYKLTSGAETIRAGAGGIEIGNRQDDNLPEENLNRVRFNRQEEDGDADEDVVEYENINDDQEYDGDENV